VGIVSPRKVSRRVLTLPLSLLVAVAFLLAALTFAGGIPSSISVPLIAGVVASLLTGGLTLLGIWMNIRYQIDRDRLDRLREAFGKLLKASVKAREAAEEVARFPKGRPHPSLGIIGSATMTAADQIALGSFEPHAEEEALIEAATDLFTEAEVVIDLELGPNAAVLRVWKDLAEAFEQWRSAVYAEDAERAQAVRSRLQSKIIELRDVARAELSRLANR
jgi:hypothetical protein